MEDDGRQRFQAESLNSWITSSTVGAVIGPWCPPGTDVASGLGVRVLGSDRGPVPQAMPPAFDSLNHVDGAVQLLQELEPDPWGRQG
jgi:hypothetical protein